jgi:hypothetical protein
MVTGQISNSQAEYGELDAMQQILLGVLCEFGKE